MYNFLDYSNDRSKVRNRFMKEMNKKTTLEDIGRLLDKFIIDEQAEGMKFLDPRNVKTANDLNTISS